MDKRNSTFYLTFLSVISSFAVVLAHTNACFFNYSNERYWFTANIIEAVFYYAVPIFFMITGVTLLDYRDKYSTKEFFKKRINKAFIPFIFWSFICIVYNGILNGTLSADTFNILALIDNILNVKTNEYYWYLQALFCIYTTIPVLSMIPKDKKIEIIGYIVIVTIIFNYIMPLIFHYVLSIKYGNSYTFHIGTNYMIYVCTGYLLHNIKFTKKHKTIIYVLGIISLLASILLTYKFSAEAGYTVKKFVGYDSLILCYASMIFILSKDICHIFTHHKFIKFITYIGQYTFSIYLLHWFFIRFFKVVLNVNIYSIVYRIGGGIFIFLGCIAITYILRKIRIMKKFLP